MSIAGNFPSFSFSFTHTWRTNMTLPPVLTKTISRILFALPIMVFGALHFMNAQAMSMLVPSFIPGGIIWVYLTGLALIAASVAIIANRYARLASLLLGILLLSFALTVHLPGVMNPDTMAASMPNLLKDTALAGAALAFAGLLKN
jgi:uncharacterized membrane protein